MLAHWTYHSVCPHVLVRHGKGVPSRPKRLLLRHKHAVFKLLHRHLLLETVHTGLLSAFILLTFERAYGQNEA